MLLCNLLRGCEASVSRHRVLLDVLVDAAWRLWLVLLLDTLPGRCHCGFGRGRRDWEYHRRLVRMRPRLLRRRWDTWRLRLGNRDRVAGLLLLRRLVVWPGGRGSTLVGLGFWLL